MNDKNDHSMLGTIVKWQTLNSKQVLVSRAVDSLLQVMWQFLGCRLL